MFSYAMMLLGLITFNLYFEGIYSSCFLCGFRFKFLLYYLAAEP